MEDAKKNDTAEFVRKPINMRDLKEQYYGSLYDNRDVMYMGPGDRNMHCILVTTSEYREGILVEAEGYAYPRYAAFVPDCRRIDLEGKEVLAQADLSSNLPMEYWRETEAKKKNERTESR